MQGGTPNWTIECLFLFCDMSMSSVTDIFAHRAGGASLGPRTRTPIGAVTHSHLIKNQRRVARRGAKGSLAR